MLAETVLISWLWLGPPSLALTFSEPLSLFHHYECVSLIRLFLCDGALHVRMRAKQFLCFNNNRIYGEDSGPVKCIQAPQWIRLLSVLMQ